MSEPVRVGPLSAAERLERLERLADAVDLFCSEPLTSLLRPERVVDWRRLFARFLGELGRRGV